jgi:isopentenyldiphosphate isomerase
MTEYVDVVDEDDMVIGTASREDVLKKKLRNRVSQVLVFDRQRNALLQKRVASKKIDPNAWDFGMAETVMAGESYEAAAVRGMGEELGVFTTEKFLTHLFDFHFDDSSKKRIYRVFSLTISNPKITPQESEISEIKWIPKTEMLPIFDTMQFCPNTKPIIQKYLTLK